MTQGQTPFVGGQGRFKNDNDLLNLKVLNHFFQYMHNIWSKMSMYTPKSHTKFRAHTLKYAYF